METRVVEILFLSICAAMTFGSGAQASQASYKLTRVSGQYVTQGVVDSTIDVDGVTTLHHATAQYTVGIFPGIDVGAHIPSQHFASEEEIHSFLTQFCGNTATSGLALWTSSSVVENTTATAGPVNRVPYNYDLYIDGVLDSRGGGFFSCMQ